MEKKKTKFAPGFAPYPQSVNVIDHQTVYLSHGQSGDVLIVIGGDLGFTGEDFTADGIRYRIAPLNHENACVLRRILPFTAPRPGLMSSRSVGVGDRLGIACPGHIRVFEKYDAFPIFAQQSIRELNLTGRTYDDVLDSVTFAVFREGFRRGFGADGDHLKRPEELEYALRCGYTMITLDCSEHIRNDVDGMSDEQVGREYVPDPELEKLYPGKTFDIGEGVSLTCNDSEYKRMVLIYGAAIRFACGIYAKYIQNQPVDFEISVDETATPTSPLQHFFVANELRRRGVVFATLAPRFCGEFQKGVDYIGDLGQFEREFTVHAVIARHFGYKISVHSGSDKFSVFPIIGRLTQGRFHLKTAGTNWLEAVKLVALKDPGLYREIHAYALSVFKEAQKYYHVTTRLDKIPDLAGLSDSELPKLFDQNDARQLIHITYGLILTAKKSDGTDLFRSRLYALWHENSQAYAELLSKHIGRHLQLLYQHVNL